MKPASHQQTSDDRNIIGPKSQSHIAAQRPTWLSDVNGAFQGLGGHGMHSLPRGVGALSVPMVKYKSTVHLRSVSIFSTVIGIRADSSPTLFPFGRLRSDATISHDEQQHR
jgi:hypothetical protein